MEYRAIPRTNIKISCITLGSMTFGTPVGFDGAVGLVRHAVKNGINSIDTANMYEGYARVAGSAGGVAEEIIGSAVQGERDKVVLGTKLGMKVGEAKEDEGTSATAIRKHLPLSLARLGTSYIDIYYLHKPSPKEDLPDMLKELQQLINEKIIRCYGVSNYSAQQLQELLDMAKSLGVALPAVCQPPLSLIKDAAAKHLLPLCKMQEIAVVPYQIYQGGLLTGKYSGGQVPRGSRGDEKQDWMMRMDDELMGKISKIEALAKAENKSMSSYALHWALRQPAVASAIVGVTSTLQIDEAIASLQ